MKNRQSGFVEWVLIGSLAAAMLTYFVRNDQAVSAQQQHTEQQIEVIKSGGDNDGRADW